MESLSKAKMKQRAWEEFSCGDYASFKGVFDSYYPSMYGYGVKLCHQPELVKDCIQDLFRSIWERRDDLLHITSPNVYLFVSLRRRILRQVQTEKKKTGCLFDEYEIGFTEFCREELIIKNEIKFQEKAKLQRALNQLSPRQKEVIYLHFYNGMSYDEIRQILSINQQSVRNHMYRAMQTLRQLLDSQVMKLVVSIFFIFPLPFIA